MGAAVLLIGRLKNWTVSTDAPTPHISIAPPPPVPHLPQRAGGTLASTARDLHGLLSAQRHLAAGVGGLRAVRRLLARCGQVRPGQGGGVAGWRRGWGWRWGVAVRLRMRSCHIGHVRTVA